MYPFLLPIDPFNICGAVINVTQFLILAATAITLIGLMWLVNRTKLGRAMRATSENPRVAGLMGVNPNFVIAATFAIGAALAALAGVMLAATYGVAHFYMGFLPGLKAFTAAVLIGGAANVIMSFIFVYVLNAGLAGIVYGTVLAVVGRCAIWMPWYVLRVIGQSNRVEPASPIEGIE